MTYPDFININELEEAIERNKRLYLCGVCKKPTIGNLSIEVDGEEKLLCERCWELFIDVWGFEMKLTNEGR